MLASGQEHNAPTYTGPAVAGSQPFPGYETGPMPVGSGAAPEATASSAATGSTSAAQPARSNTVLATLTGLVGIVVVALGAVLFINHSKKNDATPQQTVAAASSASNNVAPSAAPTASNSAPTTQASQPMSQAQTTVTNGPTQAAPAPQNDGGNPAPAQPVPAQTSTVTAGGGTSTDQLTAGADYTSTSGNFVSAQRGNTVTIYDKTSASTVSTFTVLGDTQKSELVPLPGCSHPVFVHDTNHSQRGSALFGWDGSGYHAYTVIPGDNENLYPRAGDGSGLNTYGVSVVNGSVEVRDTSKQRHAGSGNTFSQCLSSNPDVLKWDKASS